MGWGRLQAGLFTGPRGFLKSGMETKLTSQRSNFEERGQGDVSEVGQVKFKQTNTKPKLHDCTKPVVQASGNPHSSHNPFSFVLKQIKLF